MFEINLHKAVVSLCLLTIFLAGKVASFHEILHDHEVHAVECEACDKALIDQFSPFDSTTQSIRIAIIPQQFFKDFIEDYSSEIHTKEVTYTQFSRPPPSLS